MTEASNLVISQNKNHLVHIFFCNTEGPILQPVQQWCADDAGSIAILPQCRYDFCHMCKIVNPSVPNHRCPGWLCSVYFLSYTQHNDVILTSRLPNYREDVWAQGAADNSAIMLLAFVPQVHSLKINKGHQ